MFRRSPVRSPVDPWKKCSRPTSLDVFHGSVVSAGGWAGGPVGKTADVHRLDHILRGEVGIFCNSMLLGTQTCWSQGEAIRTTAQIRSVTVFGDRLLSLKEP